MWLYCRRCRIPKATYLWCAKRAFIITKITQRVGQAPEEFALLIDLHHGRDNMWHKVTRQPKQVMRAACVSSSVCPSPSHATKHHPFNKSKCAHCCLPSVLWRQVGFMPFNARHTWRCTHQPSQLHTIITHVHPWPEHLQPELRLDLHYARPMLANQRCQEILAT